jgi:hypothetical protein
MIVQVWQRVQHERFVPHPRSALDLKNTRQQLIPLKWKLERFCIRTEKGGDPHEADVAIPNFSSGRLFIPGHQSPGSFDSHSISRPTNRREPALRCFLLGHRVEFVVSER